MRICNTIVCYLRVPEAESVGSKEKRKEEKRNRCSSGHSDTSYLMLNRFSPRPSSDQRPACLCTQTDGVKAVQLVGSRPARRPRPSNRPGHCAATTRRFSLHSLPRTTQRKKEETQHEQHLIPPVPYVLTPSRFDPEPVGCSSAPHHQLSASTRDKLSERGKRKLRQLTWTDRGDPPAPRPFRKQLQRRCFEVATMTRAPRSIAAMPTPACH